MLRTQDEKRPDLREAGSMMLGTAGLFASLALLALIDATSIGTLVIPVWLVLRAKKRGDLGAAVAYLAVIGAFYLIVGLLMLGGMNQINTGFTDALMGSPGFRWVVLLLGAGMLAWSFKKKPILSKPLAPTPVTVIGEVPRAGSGDGWTAGTSAEQPVTAPNTEGRWSRRLDKALDSKWGIAVLGVTAGLLELPTMLPYLAAIGLLTQSNYAMPVQAGLLVVYCLVMLLPGLVVIGVRAVAGQRLQRPFERLSAWLTKSSAEMMPWIVGIIGFLLVRSSMTFLFPTAGWNPFK